VIKIVQEQCAEWWKKFRIAIKINLFSSRKILSNVIFQLCEQRIL
jgi:hypothetical protein